MVLAGIANSIMDTVMFRYPSSIFNRYDANWWDPRVSWRNKWKNGDPTQGEKYWGSSRWFVRFTDAWHFYQGMMFTGFIGAIVMYGTLFNFLLDFVILYLAFSVTFSVFYDYIWRVSSAGRASES